MKRLTKTSGALLLIIATTLLAGLLYLALKSRAPADYGRYGTIVVDGATRTYLLYVPPNFKRGSGALVIVLHGGSGSGWLAADHSQLNATAEKYGFAVAYPDALLARGVNLTEWGINVSKAFFLGHAPDDIGFLRALIAELHGAIGFDPNRVYVAGGSNGGMMANRVGLELSDKVAAIGVVCGTLDGFWGKPRPVAPVSVMMLHGDSDPVLPYCSSSRRPASGLPSQEYAFAFWSDANHCGRVQPQIALCDQYSITEATTKSATNCDSGVEVQFYRLIGGAHRWYTRRMDFAIATPYNPALNAVTGVTTNEILWRFFASHAKHQTPDRIE